MKPYFLSNTHLHNCLPWNIGGETTNSFPAIVQNNGTEIQNLAKLGNKRIGTRKLLLARLQQRTIKILSLLHIENLKNYCEMNKYNMI